ncbi:MAG: transporter substrate-binding domain-containing protein [Actinomycetales bacterium]|nr:transporter substrate-binding domain-containing protein [Actinomycetales bacterium]
MTTRRLLLPAVALLSVGTLLAGCAQESTSSAESTAAAPAASEAPSMAASESTAPAASESAMPEESMAALPAECSKENLTVINPGTLTIGTDSPAYPPYFVDDTPSNGQGFESAVAYAVAKGLGFSPSEVNWTVVPFNKSYAPGDKDFDFDINQISITPKRQKAVDFSQGYYTVNQAVVALNDSPIANATTLEELRNAKLGAQVGTTSLDFITQVVQPNQDPYVYNDTNDAKSALNNGQIDGIVVDLPTAYYITAAEIDNSKIVGQFQAQAGGEEFGLLFAKGNPLVQCVNLVLDDLKSSGELQAIQDQWLAGEAAPYIAE